MSWQVQEAKQRLSELLASARTQPQTITRHGRPYAVVLSVEDYDRLVGRDSFKDFLRSAPDLDDLPPRDRSPARQVEL
jgi:prevent-host-death family protein